MICGRVPYAPESSEMKRILDMDSMARHRMIDFARHNDEVRCVWESYYASRPVRVPFGEAVRSALRRRRRCAILTGVAGARHRKNRGPA